MFSRKFVTVSYRISTQSTVTIQKITCHRSLHLACRNLRRNFVVRTGQKHQFPVPVINATFIRHISESSAKTENVLTNGANTPTEGSATLVTEGKSETDELLIQIPEPPTPVQEIIETVVKTSEPTLQELGLGSWYPPGMIQQSLEFLHSDFGLPWWGSIVITTICVRMLVLPFVIKIQRYTTKMHNVQPQIQYIQTQLSEARKMGDQMEVARLSHELYQFMKDKGINPITNAGLPLIQAPIFLSCFWGLRGMVNAPVESMKAGGMLWFPDLTIPDPYYILPLLTSITMFITIEVGTDNARLESMGNIRHILRTLPFIMFPFIIKFEGAILCYWVSTNVFSLIQVSILRLSKVRVLLKIPAAVVHDKKKLPITKKNFMEGFKDSWTNMKVAREMNTRVMYDETVFENAGKGPVPKTYRYDPTKQHPLTSAILSKKRD